MNGIDILKDILLSDDVVLSIEENLDPLPKSIPELRLMIGFCIILFI